MKGKPTSTSFSSKDYVRPNQDWVCGHLCNGEACRIGPTPNGKCRVTFECVPLLELKPGETKGQYKCTRPPSAGGKCDRGPMPDGTCCNAIPKCQPRRTLRNIRKRVITFTVITSIIILFIGISRNTQDPFISPGPISSIHGSEHFSKIHHEISGDTTSCAACHGAAKEGVGSWASKAIDAVHGGMSPQELIKRGPITSSAMDSNCVSCHVGKKFHQLNMATEFACHECHKEHQGSGPMLQVNSSYCTECHGSAELMAKSRELGAKAVQHAFPSFLPNDKLKIQSRERPKNGYTEVINAFDTDHPEFRLIRDKIRDENSLKFNHAVHLSTGKIPRVLNCSDCHQRDGNGEYQQPITYEKHCVECHTLQFDPNTPAEKNKPGIYLPHGDPYYVRAFLRSLNIQYEEYGRLHQNLSRREELNSYVKEKRLGVEKLYETGEKLERSVFFADMKGELPGGFKAPFAGCATCHNVSEPTTENATPAIQKVSAPDRWMTLGKFNHDMHVKGFDCRSCHNVEKSELTSDVNLPSIKSCVDCHGTKGAIDHRCIRCHSYHNNQPNITSPGSTGTDTHK